MTYIFNPWLWSWLSFKLYIMMYIDYDVYYEVYWPRCIYEVYYFLNYHHIYSLFFYVWSTFITTWLTWMTLKGHPWRWYFWFFSYIDMSALRDYMRLLQNNNYHVIKKFQICLKIVLHFVNTIFIQRFERLFMMFVLLIFSYITESATLAC